MSPGAWADGNGTPIAESTVLERAARASAVLLGESHDDARHHDWQLRTVTALHALNPRLALGMEMFPRRVQPVLDQWVAGELDETALLRRSKWSSVWGLPPELYLPLLRFARDNRVPVIALNVERSLVRRTSREGWASIRADEREGVGDPAPITDSYRERLNAVMSGHGPARGDERERAARFERFIQAQSLWDRAMAEAIADTWRRSGRTVVAVMGGGHVRYGDGVPHQLKALGIGDVTALLPWNPDDDCAELKAGGVADAVHGIAPRP